MWQFRCSLKFRLKVPWECCVIGFTSWGQLIGSRQWSVCTPSHHTPTVHPTSNSCPPPDTAQASPQPHWNQECRRVSASVWDLARQKLRVTSTPPHFEMDPWWQLLGETSDVSISLSKEIARGSTRSPWANQTLHKAQTDALSPACYCRGGGHPAGMLSPPVGLEQTPIAVAQSLLQPKFNLIEESFKKGVSQSPLIYHDSDMRKHNCTKYGISSTDWGSHAPEATLIFPC